MSKYRIEFSFTIGEGDFHTTVTYRQSEYVPESEDPVSFLKERLRSEIKRVTKDIEFNTGEL